MYARAGFWGHVGTSMTIKTLLCPDGYCWPDLAVSAPTYSWCAGHRDSASFLCADCVTGYTEALFTTACVDSTTCGDAAWFIPVTVLLVSPGITLFLFITPQLGATEGYLKILLFFLQTLPYLRLVGDFQVNGVDLTTNGILGQLLSALNLRDGDGPPSGAVCLWAGMDAVEKEALQFAIPGLVVLWMVIFYGISFFRPTRMFVSTPLPPDHSMAGLQGWAAALPSKRDMFWAGAIQTILLVYNSVLTTALVLLSCVETADKSTVLAIHGTTPCLMPGLAPWWQWFLLVLVVLVLVPIPLWLALLKRWRGWTSRSSSMVMLESPYRPEMRDWESAVLLWRLLIVALSSLVMDPSRRLLLLAALLLLILFVHMLAHPYKRKRAQVAAAVSFFILIVLAFSNARFAVTLVELNDDDKFESVVRGFRFAFLFFPLLTLGALQLWKRRVQVVEKIRTVPQRMSQGLRLSVFSQELVDLNSNSESRAERDPLAQRSRDVEQQEDGQVPV